MDKNEVITKLGNLIMTCTPCVIDKEEKKVLFEAYKILYEQSMEEHEEHSKKFFEKMRMRQEEIDYQHWKDDYCKQMLWFYETLGLRDVHVDGDFLYADQNGIFGYNLRNMYEQFKAPDDEQ